jgi:hypothetical protein
MRRMLAPFIVLTSLLATACGGDGGGPTGSGGGGALTVSIAGILQNSTFASTITSAQLLFDGKLISTSSSATGDIAVPLSGVLTGISGGKHTITFKLISQTVQTASYSTTQVSVTYGSTGATSLNLQDKSQDLAAGESIVYDVTF